MPDCKNHYLMSALEGANSFQPELSYDLPCSCQKIPKFEFAAQNGGKILNSRQNVSLV